MRKVLFALLTILALASCTKIIDGPKVKLEYVYTSDWDLYATPVALAAKALSPMDQASIDAYNASHTDTQLIVMDAETPPEDGPDAKVTIAYADTNEPRTVYQAIPRELVSNNREGWAMEINLAEITSGRECILYVDRDPPAIVTPPPPPPPKLWTAIADRTTGQFYFAELNADEAAAGKRHQDMQLEIDLIRLGLAEPMFLPMRYDDWYVYHEATEPGL